ncbi:SusC/RagA family TonB-linked outer membrane protein [Bacteroidia bacterium]|nr:SusC/RagA family TonB-linked outer membrane protein [Bacteroidia bacterium]
MRKIIFLLFLGFFCTNAFAQKTISGTVRDASDKSSLPGVSVIVKGTTRGTATDIDGNYSITVQQGDKDLVFSFIGMKSQTVLIGNKTTINVDMGADDQLLDEVVVTALGISRDAKGLTAAQQRVDAATIAEVKDPNIVSSLAGKVAGVQVTPPGSVTGSARIVIRGNSSFTGNNQPLFVVDGMIIDNNDGSRDVGSWANNIDLGNGAADINADDIETIDVLKGPNAAALYGSRAANGAIVMTTKKAKEGRFKLSVGHNQMYHYISQWPDYENAFGVGHVLQFVQGNNQLTRVDPEGNLLPYPGIPDMREIARNGGARSAGGPHLGQDYMGLDGLIHQYLPRPENLTDFYQTGHVYTSNIAVEGGNQDNNYRVSFTNVSSNDVVERQNLVNKNTVTMRYFNTLVKNITLDTKVTYMNDDTKNRRYSNGGSFNPTSMFIYMPRTMSLDELKSYKDEAGNEFGTLGDAHNPYWSINETSNYDNRTRVMGSADLSYQILPSLRLTLRYGKDFIFTKRNEFRNKGASGSDSKGWYGNWVNSTDNNTYEWAAAYQDRLGDFSLVANVGGSAYNYGWYNTWSSIPTLKIASFQHITNSDDMQTTNEDTGRKKQTAIYGSASVGYGDWIYLEATARNDWSSTLPKGNNSYFYPSVGVSWIASEMLKIPSRTFFGKFRASWAQVGNDTDPYRLATYFNMDANNVYGNYKYASFLNTLPNASLKPEITASYEIGTDLRFWNQRLTVDFTYYKSNSRNQIISAEMAPSSGYASRVYNAGEIQNDGIELSVRGIPIETRNFSWEIVGNLTKNNSKVLSMVEGVDEMTIGGNRGMENVIKVGLPYNVLKGKDWQRDQQGRKLVYRANAEPVVEQIHYFPDVNPDWQLGISNRFRYKNFDLYLLVDIKKGGYLFSATRGQGIRNAMFSGDETDRESFWYRRFIMNDGGGYPNQWGGTYMDDIYFYEPAVYDENYNTYEISLGPDGQYHKTLLNPTGPDDATNWIPDPDYVPEKCEQYLLPQNVGYYADWMGSLNSYDASYVKVRELSIGYNLPKTLISKIKMTSARISLVGRNFWIISQKTPKGLDPEASVNAGNAQGMEYGALPPTTTFGFDIKVSF